MAKKPLPANNRETDDDYIFAALLFTLVLTGVLVVAYNIKRETDYSAEPENNACVVPSEAVD